jgi:hypothetical protein
MGEPLTISSFVIRFVQETSDPEAPITYRGAIRHVQSDASCSFTNWTDAQAFIQRYISLDTMTPGEAWQDPEISRKKS